MAEAPPPSQVPAEKGGNAIIIIGVILLLGAAGGILCWVNKGDDTAKPLPPTPSVSVAATTATPATTLDLPPIELPKDAGDDTGAAPKVASTGGGGGGSGGCPTVCTGQITDEIKSTAAARAATARQCYKTALEGNEALSGEIVMMIRVGTNGETCSASVASDSTGNGKLQQCVRGKMIATYPKPKGGCVDVKVPVVFKPKT